MRIGILTFWESNNNYGQILQLFAMQQALKKLGHDPFLIKFKRIAPKDNRSTASKLFSKDFMKTLRSKLESSKRNKSLTLDKKREFDAFKQNNIVFGDVEYQSLNELAENPPFADAYVVGSDQVWNNAFKVSAEPFLLGFGDSKVKRIAYAASFGQSQLDLETKTLFKKYLPNFNAIGVREKSGVTICEDLGSHHARWVADPTLLFNAEEWAKLLSFPALAGKSISKSIFVYTLGNSKINDRHKFLEFARAKAGYSLIHATANDDFSGNCYPTIPEWVDNIRRSEFVITTSFHGMVFCIIHNTNFVILPNTGHALGMNERITSLLGKVGLEDHMIERYDDSRVERIFTKSIDWDPINQCICEWKEKSMSFLLEAAER